MRLGEIITLFRNSFWREALLSCLNKDEEAYIVGGALREALLGAISYDIDISFRSTSLSLPFKFASEIGGKTIVLGKKKKTFKVLKSPFTFDFTPLNGSDLIEDLLNRDFTINSLALDLREEKVFDPLKGLEDIENEIVRAVSSQTFDDDPLRLLRAFRFRSSLGFKIDGKTKNLIESKTCFISPWRVSTKERIALEWKKLLSGKHFYWALRDMVETSYLDKLFPAFRLMRGMPQGKYHHLDVLNHSIKVVEALEDISSGPPWLDKDYLDTEVGSFKRKELLRLASLFHDIGKPFCFRIRDGEVVFKGHQFIGAKVSKGYARALLLGAKERDYIYKLVYNHMMPLFFLKRERSGRPWEKSLLSWILRVGEDALSVFILSLADLRATRGNRVSDEERALLIEIGDRVKCYLKDMFKVRPLLSGKEIMAVAGLKEGPMVGSIKDRILYLQRMGKLKTKDEALKRIFGII